MPADAQARGAAAQGGDPVIPRLESVYFGHGHSDQYPRMAKVLEYTARKHNPGWSVRVRKIAESNLKSTSASYSTNSWKLEHWANTVRDAADGERVLLIDADTFVTGPLDGIWEGEFDVKVTARPTSTRFPVNGGVVAVNVNPRSRAFMAAWLREDRRLLRDGDEHRKWGKIFGGMNQSSLGSLRSRPHEALVVEVPCSVWNCEDFTWKDFDPKVTRVVHVKSSLRMTVFGIGPSNAKVKHLARLWRSLEREATSTKTLGNL